MGLLKFFDKLIEKFLNKVKKMDLSFLLNQPPIYERICQYLNFEDAISLSKVIFPIPIQRSFSITLSNILTHSFVLDGVNETTIRVYELLKVCCIGDAIKIAIQNNQRSVVELLLELSSKYYTEFFHKKVKLAAYLSAAEFNNCEFIQFFLDCGVPIDGCSFKKNALIIALLAGHREAAEYLLEKGFDINFISPGYYHSPLMWISAEYSEFQLTMIDFLVEKGANLSRDLNSAFCLAVSSFCFGSLKRLYEISQERNIPVSLDQALLSWPVNYFFNDVDHAEINQQIIEMVKFLLEKGANINAVDADGDSVLHSAVSFNFVELVEELLKHQPKIFPNNQGETPLHQAAGNNNATMIKLLLDYLIRQGCTQVISCTNNQGRKAVDCTNNSKIKKLLTKWEIP